MRIRRVVMGEPETGRSAFTSVEEVVASPVGPDSRHWYVWGYDQTPELPAAIFEYEARSFYPPRDGIRVLFFEFPGRSGAASPVEFTDEDERASAARFAAERAGWVDYAGSVPGMHATDTIDIGFVVEGRVATVASDGAREILEPGDVYIQTGAPHTWEPVSDERCLIAFVLLGAERRSRESFTRDRIESKPPVPRRSARAPSPGFRRVVMGEPTPGKSEFTSIEQIDANPTGPYTSIWPVWGVDDGIVLPAAIHDYEPRSLFPPRGGLRLVVVQHAPAEPSGAPTDDVTTDDELLLGRFMQAESAGMTPYPGYAPGMHSTDTIDIGFVLSGRVTSIASDGERVVLEPGDVLVSTAAPHAWEPVGDEPCTMAVVLLGVERVRRSAVVEPSDPLTS